MIRRKGLGLIVVLLLILGVLPAFAAEPPATARPVGPVNVMAAEGLLKAPGHYFDLVGKTLRFTPAANGGYSVKAIPLEFVTLTTPSLAQRATSTLWPQRGWAIDLPFAFPFGGQRWTKVYVNYLGSLSFGQSEGAVREARHEWPNGTMRSMADSLDARAAAGLEHVIAVLWNYYDEDTPGKIRTQVDAKGLTVTWEQRRMGGRIGFELEPKPNLFQARLYPDGTIDLSYKEIAERDGIVGLFPGAPNASGPSLDRVTDGRDAPHSSVEIMAVDVTDLGSNLRFTFTMADPVPKQVKQGDLMHRILLTRNGRECGVWTSIKEEPKAYSDCGFTPGLQIESNQVSLILPRGALSEAASVAWRADVAWWSFDGRFDQVAYDRPRPLTVKPLVTDLSAMTGTATGNIYETFHYPVFSKSVDEALSSIYKRFPTDVDLAVIFTDFRYDALFASSSATGRVNYPITGIGEGFRSPRSAESVGSKQVQSAFIPVYVGAPFLAESYTGEGHSTRNYGRGLDWIAHELVHSWAAGLQFRNPLTGKIEPLYADDGCACHWRPELHVPAMSPVVATYSSGGYGDNSLMQTAGGAFWQENKDGTFTRKQKPYHFPSGLSALDLYVMGLIGQSEVPETFMLTNITDLGNDRVRATKVPVRIGDIVAAMGARQPAAAQAQKRFKLGVYLLTEPGRQPDPAMLKRTQELSAAIANHLRLITGGRMQITQ